MENVLQLVLTLAGVVVAITLVVAVAHLSAIRKSLEALVQQGVSVDRIRTVSYGKEKQFCTEDNEQCWQQNRVDHFAFDR